MKIEIPHFQKEDYLESTVPFEWLYNQKLNRLEAKQLCARMSELALKEGVRNFVALFNEYLAAVREAGTQSAGVGNQTDFEGQALALWCGGWTADDCGVTGTDRFNFEITACPHPILPVRRLKNVDTGLEKIELAFRRGGDAWEQRIFDKSTISDARSIIKLSDFGVSVNSDTAKHLVKYLGEVESLNYDRIPFAKSVGRLGWIDHHGFSPYVDNLVFDGQEEYRDRFESVREHGDYHTWLNGVRSIRETDGVPPRIILAASFASALVKPCGCLPFLLHIRAISEAGKTVGLMLGASVWANPELGRFIQSFNSTSVGKELGAAFYNSLPLMLDELQIIDGSPASRLKFQQMIYELAEGIGRTRGKKGGGLQKTGTWRNCIISTGEHPLIDSNTAGGAANRTIELFCQEKLFQHNYMGGGKAVAGFLQQHYGFAGRRFVQQLQKPENLERACELHNRFIAEIIAAGDTTDKQAASAALILTADALAEDWIFQDGVHLCVQDMLPFLISTPDMDQNRRALEFIHDHIAMNPVHFDPERALSKSVELWGDCGKEFIYIIKPQFDRMLEENGFNAGSFLSWARQNGIIRVGKDGKNTITHRIAGKVARCVCLKNRIEAEDDSYLDDLLPL